MIHAQKQILARLIAPALKTDGASSSAVLDTKGHQYAKIIVSLGLEETTDMTAGTAKLQESETNEATAFTDISGASQTHIDDTAGRQIVFDVELKPRKRYLRVVVTNGTGTGSDQIVGAVALLSRSEKEPGATSEEVANTNDYVVRV